MIARIVEKPRRCRSCPTVLSRYNPDPLCAVCERANVSYLTAPKRAQAQRSRPRRNFGGGRQPQVEIPPASSEPLGARVARLRQAMGMSRDQFAARCGLWKGTLRHVEIGRNAPNLVTFSRIAAGLGVTMDDLWHGDTSDQEATS
jgi:DNA-binding XRE family transcriptional regulator